MKSTTITAYSVYIQPKMLWAGAEKNLTSSPHRMRTTVPDSASLDRKRGLRPTLTGASA